MRRLILLFAGAFVLSFVGTFAALGQEHIGQHPPVGAPDPYAQAVSRGGANCCHGQDCARFDGVPVRKQGGWQFGKWFVRDDQIIQAETLPPSERGEHHICISSGEDGTPHTGVVRCGYVAASA